ncbi:hypothetical protein DY000_02014903 [Brassica cretica]|uniref:DUF223 domain-containing protein n=1 Tax=Brassica cretica TaxID=69181 RepID=A0ABQ7DBK9_BRACR|nr:hypothetical protein DY000_02014903 [Brassica cretica]
MGITVLFLDEKFRDSWVYSARRANHYMPSLKVGSIVKVDRFEVARCSSMYKITDHPFLIRFISPTIIDEVITDVVGEIRSVQGSDLTKETTRVLIFFLKHLDSAIGVKVSALELDPIKGGQSLLQTSFVVSSVVEYFQEVVLPGNAISQKVRMYFQMMSRKIFCVPDIVPEDPVADEGI